MNKHLFTVSNLFLMSYSIFLSFATVFAFFINTKEIDQLCTAVTISGCAFALSDFANFTINLIENSNDKDKEVKLKKYNRLTNYSMVIGFLCFVLIIAFENVYTFFCLSQNSYTLLSFSCIMMTYWAKDLKANKDK